MQRRFSLSSITVLDGLAVAATVAALAGVVWSPKLTNAVARATGSVKPVEVSVDVRHLQVVDSEAFLEGIREEGAVSIVIRNQPAGRVALLSVEDISRPLTQLLPDGTVLEAEDTSPARGLHARFRLKADAETGPSGVVFGGTKLKVGSPVELEGRLYRVNGVVSGVALP
ncbi:MAG: DUF4330 domain-containing protein [Synechococcus sp. MED-G133]|jgi:hypothetical protein|nr:DUF4330 domain-containing protein [Synechococcus sp.]RZO08911.1 MAG: DUF4330 domain-containing protein [Synechococcus sp. MED-G133]|tara:strand:- start:2170 stop:2679 length:510 start_codon:yes stop_codon:yes gene_type:complete